MLAPAIEVGSADEARHLGDRRDPVCDIGIGLCQRCDARELGGLELLIDESAEQCIIDVVFHNGVRESLPRAA